MRRIDWRLIRPPRDSSEEGSRIALALSRLWTRISDLEDGGHTESHLLELEKRYLKHTLSPCEASSAPKIDDDPDWQTRMLEEYEYLDVAEDLEDFLTSRRNDPDCERCPYASNYSLFPMDPCEFSAGALEEILSDKSLAEQASVGMGPAEMLLFAQRLEATITEGQFQEHPAIHAEDYLEKTISFLRYWGKMGFSIEPALLDERIFELAEQPDEQVHNEPTLH